MLNTDTRWLNQILSANMAFTKRIDAEKLPIARIPGPAIITCMDPRINLEAIGIPHFGADGQGSSAVRIIRTIGGMADNRSLIVGLFLAGIREIALLTHTDCGCCLAYSKIDTLIDNLQQNLDPDAYDMFKAQFGNPLREHLRDYLKAFQDPREAVNSEIEAIRKLAFIPNNLILHGLVYDLTTGRVEVVVNGYE